ncbi:hypothetical protein N0V93_009072 [Gnomoniopsis smithogilvyi]|uniref:Uncharacterized protein n=1 Tax=Gnomoniopsis smithogilvyi TaxID=1191159 RepID=A0A9W8YIZ5_9PEZI|nr:hypothetical protein N0V93_009072 [Gnomoniopsis smithogilvyi]
MNSGSPSTPLSPYTLSTERYKANVNRTKTRKWVEAKKIDYGGDDWGADDDFDDDNDDAGDAGQPVSQIPTQPSRPDRLAGLRAIGDGSGSSTPRSGSAGSARSLRPSERIAMERQGSGGPQQRNFTAPPALHVQTGAAMQQQRTVPPALETQESLPAAQSPYPPRKSSMGQQDRPDLTINPAAKHPPRTSSRSASPGVISPGSGAGSSAGSKVIRPSDIYKRVEEEKEKERKSIDSTRRSSLASSGDGDGPDASGNSARRLSFGKNDGGDGSRSLHALAPVAERKSEYGFDGLMINPGAPPPQQPQVSSDVVTETPVEIEPRHEQETLLQSESGPPKLEFQQTSTDQASTQGPKKRFSTSPKLPDFARMSGFGSDFFSSGGGFLGGSPKQPEAYAEATAMPATGSNPTGVTRAAEPTHHEGEPKLIAQTDDQSAALSNTQPPPEPSHPKPFRPSLPGGWVSETPSSIGETATPFEGDSNMNTRIPPIGEDPEDLALKPAPLRTPTPRDRETFAKSADGSRASSRSGRASPVKPLALRTSLSPLVNVEQPGQDVKDGSRTPERQDDNGAQGASDKTPVAVAPLQPRPSGSDSPGRDSRAPILRTDTLTSDSSSPLKESDVLRDEIIRSLSPVRGSDSHLEAQGADGATRESAYLSDVYGDYWAGGDQKTEGEQARDIGHTEPLSTVREDDSASATPTPPAGSELDSTKPDLKRERFSWEAASESPAPSPKKHPLPELPKDEPSPGFEAPQLASPLGSGPMSPLIALPTLDFDRNDDQDSNTPHSPTDDHEFSTSANRGSELFSPSTEKMTLDSPTTPTGEGLTSLDPEPLQASSPAEFPLPRSPSPNKVAGDDTPPTSSSQNTMNLKQIMALPTSPERVYKMLEARAEFASTPSGLPDLLAELLAQPEHANAGPSFKYAPAGADLPLFANQRKTHQAAAAAMGGEGASAAGGPGRRSSITLGGGIGGGGGSARIGSMSGATAAQLGHLMHGPAGAKGKELLQSAGKMGKGLLSKGKSKLRERAESKKG